MSPLEIEQRLARSLDDFRARRTRGEHPSSEEYADELADAYGEFVGILEVEELLDHLLEPPPEEALPREFGHYTLVREIGRGAVGIVYEAIHRELGRSEAVKVLRGGFEEGSALERFRQEAKTLARVRHENIVSIYGAGQVDDQPYYAMALVEGRPLSHVVRDEDRPSSEDLCRGLAGVADALQALHDRGIIHRDVKPSNIIVRHDGRMMLADFGLVRMLGEERITRTGQALGTPLYMSPEQILARRGDIDGRTDVYELGATLYEVLSGRPVFPTDDLRALVGMVISSRPVPLHKEAPDVPQACSDIVMKAIEKRRRDRYASAGAMRDDLLAFAAGEHVQGHPVSRVRRGLRRIKVYAVPIAAVLLLALAWGIWFVNRSGVLHVTCGYPAEVWVDGIARGPSPQSLDLPPGTYRVELRDESLETEVFVIELSVGEPYHLMVPAPRLVDPDDPEAVARLAKTSGLGEAKHHDPERHRGPGDPKAWVLPEGRVRLRDLTTYVVEVSRDFPLEGGEIVWRRGGEILHREPFVPRNTRTEAPIPDEVLSKLGPGDEVSWGFEATGAAPHHRTFDVVPDDASIDARLARVDEATAKQDGALRAYFRARLLIDEGLAVGAYREIVPFVHLRDGRPPESGQLAPLIVLREALGAMEGRESDMASRVRDALQFFPRDRVRAWCGEDEAE